MNLDAIRPRKGGAQDQTAAETAQRSVSYMNSGLLFRNVPAPIQAAIVAKAAADHAPVKPVALAAPAPALAPTAASGDLTAVLKAMTDGFNKAAAAIRGQVQKAAPATAPAAAPAAPATGLNTMLGSEAKRERVAKLAEAGAQDLPPATPPSTAGQLRREAEAREQARKAAAQADAERVLVTKGGGRVRVLRELDRSLSEPALSVLSHIVTKWEANDRRPVKVNAPDLARALDLPLATAQAAYTELVDRHLVISAANTLGVVQVQPGLGVAGA